jgi:hypothetical protein
VQSFSAIHTLVAHENLHLRLPCESGIWVNPE